MKHPRVKGLALRLELSFAELEAQQSSAPMRSQHQLASAQGEPETSAASKIAAPGLDLVYRNHARDVSRWIKRLWGLHDAEDVLHEVFLVVQRKLPAFRGECSITTWLYSITVRVVMNRRRITRVRRLLFARAADQALDENAYHDPALSAECNDSARKVYGVLDELPERDRVLLLLFEIEGMDAPTIGRVMNMKPNAVWVALSRARTRFKRIFLKRYPELESWGHVST